MQYRLCAQSPKIFIFYFFALRARFCSLQIFLTRYYLEYSCLSPAAQTIVS